MRTSKEKISLLGHPPYAVLIRRKPWDITGFRPNPSEYMKPGRHYLANVQISIENLPSGKEIPIPRKILVFLKTETLEFTNIR